MRKYELPDNVRRQTKSAAGLGQRKHIIVKQREVDMMREGNTHELYVEYLTYDNRWWESLFDGSEARSNISSLCQQQLGDRNTMHPKDIGLLSFRRAFLSSDCLQVRVYGFWLLVRLLHSSERSLTQVHSDGSIGCPAS